MNSGDRREKPLVDRTPVKGFLKEVVFIEMRAGRTLSVGDMQIVDAVPLPVHMDSFSEHIIPGEAAPEYLPPLAFIKGLIYTLGADDALAHRSVYRELLYALDADMPVQLLKESARHSERGDIPRAVLYALAAVELAPESVAPFYDLGCLYLKLEGYEKVAKRCFRQCLHLDAAAAPAAYQLGYIHYNDGQYAQAEAAWKRALSGALSESMRQELAENLTRIGDKVRYEKGSQLVASGRHEEGLLVLKTLEDVHDDWWELLFFIGVGHRMAAQYDLALPYFLKVLTLNTGHVQSMNEAGICFLSLGNFSESERLFKEALKLAPGRAEYICNLGIVALNRGDKDAARVHFDEAYALDPEDEVILAWRAHMNRELN